MNSKPLVSRNLSIDALRAIAALAVLFYHSSIPPFPVAKFGVHFYDQWIFFWGRFGCWGVDLFFILSGFCIHWGVTKPEMQLTPKNYLIRRWWRIYPPYFFALGFAVLLHLVMSFYKAVTAAGGINPNNFGLGQIFSHVFLVHNLFSSTITTVNGPFWTVAVESQYYLLYLLVVRLFFSNRGWLLVAAISGGLYLIAGYLTPFNNFQPWQPFLYWPQWIEGAWLAYIVRRYPAALRYWPIYLFALIACVIGLGMIWPKPMSAQIHFCLLSACMGFLIMIFIRFKEIWAWPVLRWLPTIGTFSYSIYLIHFPLLDRVRTFVIPAVSLGWGRVAVSLGALVASIMLAYVFFIYFEKPFLDKAASIPTYKKIG